MENRHNIILSWTGAINKTKYYSKSVFRTLSVKKCTVIHPVFRLLRLISPPPEVLQCELMSASPSFPHRQKTPAGIESAQLCPLLPGCKAQCAQGIREQEVITFSVCYDLSRRDVGRLIRRRGWRSRGETCVTINSYVISNRSDAPRRVSPPF